MRINNNLMAMNAHRNLGITNSGAAKSMEKLSSGFRINRAGDDAAGLAISEKMRGQIRGLNQASRNAQDGISLIQTAEGALQEVHAMAQRMRELAVQANNDTNTNDDLAEIQKEIDQLKEEITRVGNKTEFNTKTLLNGSLGVQAQNGTATIANLTAKGISLDVSGVKSGATLTFALGTTADPKFISVSDGTVTQQINIDPQDIKAGATLNFDKIGLKMSFAADVDLTDYTGSGISLDQQTITTTGDQIKFQIGANGDTVLNISISDMRASALGKGASGFVNSLNDVNVTNAGQGFDENIKVIDQAIKEISAQRSQLGAWQNRLEHTIKNLDTSSENLQAAESRIRDVDMAKEMMEFSKNNILQQAAQAMLAQANQAPQGVLQLLR
ncbi:flagellin [Alkalithermobacter thermoalcaliphilus JW-YL-7 = DSM 7308]|uniref:Flagellin n=1 Tax=Alkalithermobacter thermoalcaliphilus JW-YL-7 = DSM 7308 TaxID=1121328 RepID=A0A150FTE4_CLOPD|nr:flagellin domain protein [[Clostridium] paradoxum JW-YL-7 = DSM 7308]SHL38367.1 flagellin [[Clostridium] paradoxum JW-YL-7 = DSM 7308]